MTKEYKLAKIEDFLKLPADRIHDCMAELADHFCNLKLSMELMSLTPDLMGLDKMVWVDDGGKYVKTTINFEGSDEVIRIQYGEVPEEVVKSLGEVS